MKLAFLILPLAMALSACAHDMMTADAGPCKPDVRADWVGGSAALLGSGLGGLEALAKDDHDGSRFTSAIATTACTRKNPTPHLYDLHKIGDGPAPSTILLGSGEPSCPHAHRA